MPSLRRVDQHVRENRNRVLPLDDALQKRKFFQQVVLADDEFHRQGNLSLRADPRNSRGISL